MYKKTRVRVVFVGILVILVSSIFSCAPTIYTVAGHLGQAALLLTKPSNTKPTKNMAVNGQLIEQYTFGGNTVNLNEVVLNGKPGYLFTANRYGQLIKNGGVFFKKNDEMDMKKMNKFFQMNLTEKRRYIHETFLKVGNVNLGPIDPGSPAKTSYLPRTSLQ